MVAALIGNALISPIYPLYQDQWGLSASDVANLYVIYMVGALAGLLFLGRLGDRIGFAATLLIALMMALAGSLICMLAQEAVALAVGRFLVGIAGTLATSSGVAGLTLLTPREERGNIALKCSLLVAFGFGLGPVVGGIVGQWLALPLVVVHLPSVVMLVFSVWAIHRIEPRLKMRELKSRLKRADFMPRLTWPHAPHRATFALACILPFITFGVFGLYASMSPTIIRNVLGLGGPLVSGAGIALILTGSCFTQISFRRMHYARAAMVGFSLLALSSIIMIANLRVGSGALFGLGLLLTAMGHGASMFGGSQAVNLIADDGNRASLTASFWAVGYCGSIVPMIGMGVMSDLWGINVAVTSFCALVIAMCAAGAAAYVAVARMRGPAQETA